MNVQAAPLWTTPAPPPANDSAISPTPGLWQDWEALSRELEPILMNPQAQPAFEATLRPLAQGLLQLTQQDADLAIFHLVHGRADKLARYSVLHAMHTAMLLSLVGQRKEWGEARTLLGIQAALTMNLSIMHLQVDLAHQQSPLTEAQRAQIHDHPLQTRQMLQALGVQHDDWLQAVSEHHEQADGQGYPLGLSHIHPLADALHTCDIFGAKLSPRAGRQSMLSPRAAAEIFRQRSMGYFGATIVREIGLYPPGCMVELASGEQAVVLRRMPDQSAPDVAVLTDPQGQALSQVQRCHTRRGSGRHVVSASLMPCAASDDTLDAVLSLM